jgi:hypothetical protein
MDYSLINFREQYGNGPEAIAKLAETMKGLKLSDSSLFREFFSTADGASVVPAQFLAQIVLGATSNPLFRAFAPVIPLSVGESVYVRRADDDTAAAIVAEGSEALADAAVIGKFLFEFRKYVKRPMWSYEALADTPIDLIGINNQLMGNKVTVKEDQMGMCDLYKWSTGTYATTYSNTVDPVGSATYLNNLIDTMVHLAGDEGFYKADTIIMSPAGYKLLLKDANLPSAAYWGEKTFIQSGELSRILGCNIFVRDIKKYDTDGITPVQDTGSTYVLDSRFAVATLERQPLTIDSWNIEARQMTNANIWMRSILGILQPKAYRLLTAKTS